MGEGVVNANIGMTYEMLCNLELALEHHEKVCEGVGGRGKWERREYGKGERGKREGKGERVGRGEKGKGREWEGREGEGESRG